MPLLPRSLTAALVAVGIAAAGCGDDADPEGTIDLVPAEPAVAADFGPAPAAPDGPLDESVVVDLDALFGSLETGAFDLAALDRLGVSGDARLAWLFTDLLRFTPPGSDLHDAALRSWEEVTGAVADGPDSPWGNTTDHLLAWDTPAPPGYVDWKRQVFELVEPAWAPFFDDEDATVDWRWVSWGGVRIDDRPLDRTEQPCPEGCIPALNDPELTDAAGGDWYPDNRVVFGLVVDGQALALPRNIMEVHEMVNLTVAGRRIAVPYCTLCGSAQAYLTDEVADGVDLGGPTSYEMRTSGLLSRSNKVMFEFHTRSLFDTFTGEAVSGPLLEAGVQLEQLTVRTATWADWKAAHPETSIVAEDGGIGRTYALDPLRGRDDAGPIFPIGPVDPRLPVQGSVAGVVLDDGTAIAFPAGAAAATLGAGGPVEFDGVELSSDGAGFVATVDGDPVPVHQAFWFAWSQFHPDTSLWEP